MGSGVLQAIFADGLYRSGTRILLRNATMTKGRKGRGGGESGLEKRSRSDSEEEVVEEWRKKLRAGEEGGFKLMIRFKDGGDVGSPIKISEEIGRIMSNVVTVRKMERGKLMVLFGREDSRTKAMKVTSMLGRAVEYLIPDGGVNLKGVIYVEEEVSEEEIVSGVKEVEAARRFKEGRMAVLVTFKQEVKSLPADVLLGYMVYPVKQYVRPPLRCYRCQRYGHVAAVCRGSRRCGKCGGDHEFAQCSVGQVKCCNCGGDHITSFRGCSHHARAVKVEEVKERGKISYAEAVKKVLGDEVAEGSRLERSIPVVQTPQTRREAPAKAAVDLRNTRSFLAFVVDVLARPTMSLSDRVRDVVQAAGDFLGMEDIDPGEIHLMVREKVEEREIRKEAEAVKEGGRREVGRRDRTESDCEEQRYARKAGQLQELKERKGKKGNREVAQWSDEVEEPAE